MKAKNLLLFIGGSAVAGTGQALTSSQAHADTVTVKKGDTTWKIANEHKTTVDQIVKDNNLKDGGKLIFENQKLEVNTPGTNSSTENSSTSSVESSSIPSQTATSVASSTSNVTSETTSFSSSNQVAQQSNTSSQSSSQSTSYTSSVSGNEASAKEWIAARESGGSYTAQNASSGAYGRYQLLPGYLHGDYSPANQEKVADNYVKSRYGSWSAAQSFWQAHGWY